MPGRRTARNRIPFANRPSFQLEFGDLGNGAVSLIALRGGVPGTFTRATAAAAKLSTGLWKLDVASGVARYSYNGLGTTVQNSTGGYYAEGAATQLALNPRDMTQAAWVAVNVTPTQVATGIDGVGNSATRLTSAAIGGSILQTLVAAASSRTYSVWLRRVTGTGTITISQGATQLDVTASLNSSTYTRVELNASVLNSAFGITFGASGDVIETDCNQFESGAFASSPIPASGTRNADALTYPTTGWYNAAIGTGFSSGRFSSIAGQNFSLFAVSDGTLNNRINFGFQNGGPMNYRVLSGGVASVSAQGSGTVTANSAVKVASAYNTNDFSAFLNGASDLTDTTVTPPTGITTAFVGLSEAGAGVETFGTISRVVYFPRRLPDSQLQVLTT